MPFPPPILDDLKDTPKTKRSRKSVFCLGIAIIAVAFIFSLLYLLDWTKGFHEYLAITVLIIAAIASFAGLIFGAMSLIKNEEDVLFQLVGILGNSAILFVLLLGVLSAIASS